MVNVLKLATANDVGSLIETPILPAQEFRTYENFLVFPSQSGSCIPKRFVPKPQYLPRFSIFATDSVVLNGFRLLRHAGHLFTDMSLIARQLETEEALFNKKITQGVGENINFSALDATDASFETVARDGPILLPCSDEPSNFGSWIYRIIPKIMLSEANVEFESIMIYQQPWMTDLIRYLGFTGELINHIPVRQYHVHQPLIPSLPVPYVYFRPEVRDCLNAVHDVCDNSVSLGDYIYVSRRNQALKNARLRALENETGLVAALEDLGFREFMPEKYSFAEQVSIFGNAKIIVGSGGSNMFGSIFARNAELILDIESGEEWSHAHANLLTSTRGQWSMIKGLQLERGFKPHLNWTIDIDTVVDGLRKLLSEL